jgi:hypothetical protein
VYVQSPVPAEQVGHRFDRRDAAARLKEHSASHYAGLYNVMKGVTLAAAGLALIRLLEEPYPDQRGLLLAVGLLAIVVTYNGAVVGQVVVHLDTSPIDVILPMALTIAEFGLIGLAAINPKAGPMPEEWFLALGAWQLLAALVVLFVALRLDASLYAPTLWPAVNAYRQRLYKDVAAAGLSGLLTLGFWWFRRDSLPLAGTLEYVFIALILATLVGALAHHESTRRQLKRNLL